MAGLVLAILLILPTELFIGFLVSLMPSIVAVGIGLIALFCGVVFGSAIITKKFGKR